MSEAHDPLEAELSALRPHEVSPDLRRRVAERLGGSAPEKTRRSWVIALAGGLAACAAAVLLWWGWRNGQPQQTIVQPPSAPTAAVEAPTLQAYRLALARSPEDFDALLDRQAVSAPEPDPPLAGINAFTRSDAALHTLLGDD